MCASIVAFPYTGCSPLILPRCKYERARVEGNRTLLSSEPRNRATTSRACLALPIHPPTYILVHTHTHRDVYMNIYIQRGRLGEHIHRHKAYSVLSCRFTLPVPLQGRVGSTVEGSVAVMCPHSRFHSLCTHLCACNENKCVYQGVYTSDIQGGLVTIRTKIESKLRL